MDDVLALLIPIFSVVGFFTWLTVHTVLKSRRLTASADPGLRDELLQAVDDVRREVAELAERVDFTERLLAKQKEAERLGPPR